MNEYDLIGSEGRHSRSVAGGVATVALAAAVGAGVALLFTTDAGARARGRVAGRLRDLELGERAERASHAARDGFETIRRKGARRMRQFRHEPERDRSGALYATLGTVAGAALAALLTPQGGRETRDWIGHQFDDLRQNASLKWKEHRARRKAEEPADEALRRLEGNGIANGHEEWAEGVRE